MPTLITKDNLAANTITAEKIASTVALGGPKISSLDYPGDDTAALPAGGQTVTINGTGFVSGATVYLDGTVVSPVTFNNANSISFTTPAKSANSYVLYVINPDGATAIAIPGLTYSGVPTWTTSAGSLGAPYEANSFSVTLQATSDSNVTFSMSAGNTLPIGLSLAANGLLSGTIPATEANTTYTFYVDAIDAQNQETSRTFSITYTRDTVTWSSPANGTAYSLNTGVANTITLQANSEAGKTISYTVQSGTLPANVSISGANVTGTPNTGQNNTAVVIRATAADTNRFADRTLYFYVSSVIPDQYYNNVSLLLNFNGSNNSTTIVDSGTVNTSINLYGSGSLRTNIKKFGTASYYNPGAYSYLRVPTTNILNFGSGNWTVEAWVYRTESQSFPSGGVVWSLNQLFFAYTDGGISAQFYDSAYNGIGFSGGGGNVLLNTWQHIAIVRSGNDLLGFIDGVNVSSGNANQYGNPSIATPPSYFSIGAHGNESFGQYAFAGYIDDLRITKGIARYTGNFTPPASEFANTA